MYCQKCGKQIDDGSAFCQHCGAQIGNSVSDNFSNRNANLNFNVQHTERKTERIKSKEEFMDDYHTKHPERMVYVVLFIILEIAATIVFIMNVSSYIDHHRDENITGMMIAAFLEIIAVIFACAIQKVNSSANKAYDMYLNNINSRSNNFVKLASEFKFELIAFSILFTPCNFTMHLRGANSLRNCSLVNFTISALSRLTRLLIFQTFY